MKIEPFTAGSYYHIYNRGNNKENIFKEKENYHYFLRLMQKHLLPVVDIYSYCLLPNHFHLVVKFKDEFDLPEDIACGKKKISQPFSNFFNAYSKAINKRFDRTGSLFQKHLKRKKITSSYHLQKTIIYVNTNPDHHGFGNYIDYPYSSYKSIISNANDVFVCRKSIISFFEDLSNFKFTLNQKRYTILIDEE